MDTVYQAFLSFLITLIFDTTSASPSCEGYQLEAQNFRNIGGYNCHWKLQHFQHQSTTLKKFAPSKSKMFSNFSDTVLSTYIRKLVKSTKWAFSSQVICQSLTNHTLESLEFIYKSHRRQYPSPSPNPAQQKFVRILNPNLGRVPLTRAGSMRPRDFHDLANASVFLSIGKVIQEILKLNNKTGLSLDSPIPPEIQGIPIAAIQPNAFSSALSALNRGLVNNKSYHHFQSFSVPYNHAYCAPKTLEDFSIRQISVLLSPFQWSVWTAVITTLLSLSLALTFVTKYSWSPLDNISILITLMFDFLAVSIKDQRVNGRLLHVCWLYACVLLNNLYTGTITSTLIKPSPEETLESLKDLVVSNYVAIFPKFLPAQLTAITEALKIFENNTDVEGNTNVVYFRKLVGENPEGRHLMREEYMKSFLSTSPKVALVAPSLFAIQTRNKAQNMLKLQRMQELKKTNQALRRKTVVTCHIGKQLVVITSAANYWSFFPPYTNELYRSLQLLAQNGIFFMWMKEFFGMNYADRVQDRQKVLSSTQIASQDTQFHPMGFHHTHTTTIFLLWTILIVLSFVWFILFEILCTKVSRRLQGKQQIVYYYVYME